jgi:cysteinyl-tRNA synthetase
MKKESILSIEIDLPFNTDLAKRDIQIQKMEDMIREKKQFLLEKRDSLNDLERNNEYLQTVQNDYVKYYNHIVGEKESQMRYMEALTKYIEDIIHEGKLTEEDAIRAEWEQKKIMMEITKIKDELDKIIQNDLFF